MRRSAILAGLIVTVAVPASPASITSAAASSPARLHRSNLDYRGAFLLPAQVSDSKTFAYGGTALASDPARDSLFVVGHDWYQLTAEVTTPRATRGATPSGLRRARFLQPFADATDGKIDATGETSKIGGQLVYRHRLYGTVYVYYDADGSQAGSHWVRPSTSLSSGDAKGLFRLGTGLGNGFVSGYMSTVPRRWRERLGGPALTGNCCIPIISRTSFGPAAFAFDPERVGDGNRTPVKSLVYYSQDHPTLGAWDATWDPAHGVEFNGATTIRGLVFPNGTRSVLFIGTQGTGPFCYGEGTDDPGLDGTPTPDGSVYCYDPDDSSKGTHAYPYVPEVWAYDAADLNAVRQGRMRPWQLNPYAVWRLQLPYGSGRVGGAAYDRRRRLLYVSQQYGDGAEPVIHVFGVG